MGCCLRWRWRCRWCTVRCGKGMRIRLSRGLKMIILRLRKMTNRREKRYPIIIKCIKRNGKQGKKNERRNGKQGKKNEKRNRKNGKIIVTVAVDIPAFNIHATRNGTITTPTKHHTFNHVHFHPTIMLHRPPKPQHRPLLFLSSVLSIPPSRDSSSPNGPILLVPQNRHRVTPSFGQFLSRMQHHPRHTRTRLPGMVPTRGMGERTAIDPR